MPVNNGERAAASIRCEPSDGLVRNLLRAPIVDDCEQPIASLRFAAGVILLLPVVWFTWLTVDGLAARRQLRTDLAEITHVRYGLLSADRWRDIIAPIPQFDHSDENATVSDTKKFSQVVQFADELSRRKRQSIAGAGSCVRKSPAIDLFDGRAKAGLSQIERMVEHVAKLSRRNRGNRAHTSLGLILALL